MERPYVTLRRGEATPASLSAALNELGIDTGEDFVVQRAVPPEETNGGELGPFQRESETSRQAAIDNYPRQGTQRWRVLAVIAMTGGATRDEIDVSAGLPMQSTTARVWELERKFGYVETSAVTRTTRAGSEANVMVLTPRGRDAVRAHDPSWLW